jgi:ribosome-associated protein
MLKINETIIIEDWELSEQFVRASGPGGQNVNKVASAVELRFAAASSPNLPDWVKAALKRRAGRRWTKDGAVVLQCDETRSQAHNRELVRARLVEMVRAATVRPRRRVATRPSLGAKRRRMDEKTKRGVVKGLRGKVTGEE